MCFSLDTLLTRVSEKESPPSCLKTETNVGTYVNGNTCLQFVYVKLKHLDASIIIGSLKNNLTTSICILLAHYLHNATTTTIQI